jgi:uncharacterized protein YndB with AHSA1/START domain
VDQTTDMARDDGRPELTVTRVIDAPRALVFKAWTQAEHAARWWGPQGFTTESCQMDVRPGGSFRSSMRSPTGSIHTKHGVYREVTAPERLVFTFAWEDEAGNPMHETLITVTFEDVDSSTRLTLHQAFFESESLRDEHAAGWTSCLERFAEYMVANTVS